MWDDLLAAAAGRGFRIRGIWIADVAWQGSSSVLNEDKLGNDPSWCDHSRDLLHMINMLRAEMPRPLVGVGHSFGGTIITYLSLMHPRLFTTLVLMDPVINFTLAGPSFGFSTLALSAVRRDLWPSRQAAAASFGRSAFYQRWDPRVLRVWIEHGIRETPTALYPDAADAGKATLTSTKHMEIFTYLRPTLQGVDPATGHRVFARSHVPDIGDDGLAKLNGSQLYRPEVPNVATQLPQVRPGVLWICGGDSLMSTPELRKEKMDLTGVGVGGSGGVAAGRVREVVLEGRRTPSRHGQADRLRAPHRRVDRLGAGPLARGREGARGLVVQEPPRAAGRRRRVARLHRRDPKSHGQTCPRCRQVMTGGICCPQLYCTRRHGPGPGTVESL